MHNDTSGGEAVKKTKHVALTEATYLILLSLVEPLHGYGIMQKIEIMSDGRVKMGPGTLYGGLSSLVEKKMIRRIEEEGGEDRKKMYKLTDAGMNVLENEYLRLKQMLEISEEILKRSKKND